MYSQFFGNYLLSKHAVTNEQLLRAMQEQHSRHVKLGTLAMHAGLMNAEQVDNIIIRQTHENRRFGDLAIEEGYLTKEQVDALLEDQTPDYLLIGQALIDDGILTNTVLEELITSYKNENKLAHLDLTADQNDNLQELIRNLFLITVFEVPDYIIQYIDLLFNNLIRFIGEDFTPLNPSLCLEYLTKHCSGQALTGEYSITSYFDLAEDTAIQFASRYVGENFTEYDEYVQASIEDFLNLHNGLFNVNISNETSVELHLLPPENMDNTMLSSTSDSVLLPIFYPFGVLNFLIKY